MFVFRGETIGTNQEVAIKVMKTQTKRGKMQMKLIDELANLRQCEHPNIVQFLDSFLVEDSLWLVMECIDGVTLDDVVTREAMNMHQIRFICKKILLALECLHTKGIIHRDIKGNNILLGKDGLVKLTDFGSSVLEKERKLLSLIGTALWMAPEMIDGKVYNCSVDIWSFGITVIEMLQGYPPYLGEGRGKALMLILENGTPNFVKQGSLQPELQDFLQQCLHVDPAKASHGIKSSSTWVLEWNISYCS